MNSNKKGFYRNIISKRKTRENMASLLNRAGTLMKIDVEKAELLNALPLSLYRYNTLRFSRILNPVVKSRVM